MHSVEQLSEVGEAEQKRVDKVVDILTTMTTRGEDVAEIAHDACNMVTALDLYCDLLQVPGVLGVPFSHYGGELRLVAAASRRLVDKLMLIDGAKATASASKAGGAPSDSFLPLKGPLVNGRISPRNRSRIWPRNFWPIAAYWHLLPGRPLP